MLYRKNAEKSLSPDLFKQPTSEYRGAPFWAWNCHLEKDELLRQLDILAEMGFGFTQDEFAAIAASILAEFKRL